MDPIKYSRVLLYEPPQACGVVIIIIIIIIIIFLHGLGRLTCSAIDALPSFPGASTISSSSRFVVEGVFRKSGVVNSFKMVPGYSTLPRVWRGTVEYTKVTQFLCQTRGTVTGLNKKMLQWILIHPCKRPEPLRIAHVLFDFHPPMRATVITHMHFHSHCVLSYLFTYTYSLFCRLASRPEDRCQKSQRFCLKIFDCVVNSSNRSYFEMMTVLKSKNIKKHITSSVYDCTVEDVENA